MTPSLQSFRTATIVAAVMLAGTAFGQVFKCPGPAGRVIYSDVPCEGGRSVNTQGNSVAPAANPFDRFDARRPPASPSMPSRSPAQCPTEQEIRNMKTSASSIRVQGDDATVQAEQIRRAEACQPLMTDAEVLLMKEELRAQRRASRPAPQSPAPTGPKTCWQRGSAIFCP